MFVLRSIFWLGTVVLLLPPATSGGEPPRVSLLHTAYAARVLIEDVTGVCQRNPDACAASREALALVGAKLETGAGIAAAAIEATRGTSSNADAPQAPADASQGTLTQADLEPAWIFANTETASR